MLRRLKVVNFAIVERMEVEFGAGFTAFTGETGAGKSILLEALGFLLGARGSASWLRSGCDRLEVEGVFDAADLPSELRERYKAGPGTFTVRRDLDAAGKTRAMIDSQSAPVAALGALGEAFADFHGQHEHQALLRPSVQLELLDRYGGLEPECSTLAEAYGRWSALSARLSASSMSEGERRRRVDLMRFQLEEIDTARPRLGEEEELDARLPRLKHADRLRTFADQVHGLLYADEDAAISRLMKAERALGELAKIDPSAARLQGELEIARLTADAVAHEVGDYRDRAAADPAALDALLCRQDALMRLKKKHGPTLAEVLATRERLAADLDGLENADARIEETRQELAETEKALAALCEKVHAKRVQAAKRLDVAVLKELKVLGMPHSRFSCSIEMEEGNWSRSGADAVEFLLSANPGEPPRPVKAVASGGELSRVMLGLKTSFAKADRTPLLVFDEVDAGIGGAVALAVGEKLASLAKGRQVFCVTHLPQVACRAQTHFHVAKEVVSGRTRVRVERLDGGRRLDTVALMLGGRAATVVSRKHAEELLENTP
ncbi:MAG TPA: DNA repair protein RecN [Elusimicrobia bacterium]|nr:MAG: DNA repair protein RecN [Elusimicrobia bacterium GWA2_66_18]OGR72446.1 MAG: DNA repair protein RecN [Elusimicrobia bacterium GWC2_65_9]HAZ07076.1 DNA repair protein RecN [Elusimicrobiota bacterium]